MNETIEKIEDTVVKYKKPILIALGIVLIYYAYSSYHNSSSSGTSNANGSSNDPAISALQNGYNQLATAVNGLTSSVGGAGQTVLGAVASSLNLDLSVSGQNTANQSSNLAGSHSSSSSGFGGLTIGTFNLGGSGSKSSNTVQNNIQTSNSSGGYDQSLKYAETGLSSTDLGATLASFLGITKIAQNNAATAESVPNPYYNNSAIATKTLAV
jgi:hypothetical protein